MKYRIVAGSAVALAASMALPHGIIAGEGDYIGLFGGHWSGSGMVVNDQQPHQVSCNAVGKPGQNHLTITGSCGVFLVSVPIAADVNYDPSSGRYSGTYTGGDMVAHISGKRSGDTVAFTMTWAGPIDRQGDTSARLTIVNSGQGSLRILIDNVKATGPNERTSDLTLRQG